MKRYQVVPVRAFNDNYIWTIRDARHAIVVDPGDATPVLDYLAEQKLELAAILITHHHNDHIGGVKQLISRRAIPVYGPHDSRVPDANQPLKQGESITLPYFDVSLTVMEVPGHTRSHIAYYGDGMLFCGDTLFAAGCGRLFEGTVLRRKCMTPYPGSCDCLTKPKCTAPMNTRWPTFASHGLWSPITRC